MMSEAPPFWWEKPDWRALALSPFSMLYGGVSGRRIRRAKPPTVSVPVLCIGNFTVGGAGKTPTSITFAKVASALGLTPGIVSRGYGGTFSGLHRVDPGHDSARLVGDEPLLLARYASVIVSSHRYAAAQALQQSGCDFIIMDDGFQSARLHFDFALMVVDAGRGVGNGHVLPAGPLRAPLIDQLIRTDAVLKVGTANGADRLVRNAARAAKPIYEGVLKPVSTSEIAGKRLLAFAGIGDPSKFFKTLGEAGGVVEQARAFPDHHPYTEENISELAQAADRDGLIPVTTTKDLVRLLDGSPAAKSFAGRTTVLEVELVFSQSDAPARIIRETRDRARHRRLGAS